MNGVHFGNGAVAPTLNRAQSSGSMIAERQRHRISAGPIEANRDRYQLIMSHSAQQPYNRAEVLPYRKILDSRKGDFLLVPKAHRFQSGKRCCPFQINSPY